MNALPGKRHRPRTVESEPGSRRPALCPRNASGRSTPYCGLRVRSLGHDRQLPGWGPLMAPNRGADDHPRVVKIGESSRVLAGDPALRGGVVAGVIAATLRARRARGSGLLAAEVAGAKPADIGAELARFAALLPFRGFVAALPNLPALLLLPVPPATVSLRLRLVEPSQAEQPGKRCPPRCQAKRPPRPCVEVRAVHVCPSSAGWSGVVPDGFTTLYTRIAQMDAWRPPCAASLFLNQAHCAPGGD
jgi:hypothetical protein